VRLRIHARARRPSDVHGVQSCVRAANSRDDRAAAVQVVIIVSVIIVVRRRVSLDIMVHRLADVGSGNWVADVASWWRARLRVVLLPEVRHERLLRSFLAELSAVVGIRLAERLGFLFSSSQGAISANHSGVDVAVSEDD
jgi:hypothetical protein